VLTQPIYLVLACPLATILYLVVIPIIRNYFAWKYYTKQGLVVPSGFNFVTGSLDKYLEFEEARKREQTNMAFSHIIKKEF